MGMENEHNPTAGITLSFTHFSVGLAQLLYHTACKLQENSNNFVHKKETNVFCKSIVTHLGVKKLSTPEGTGLHLRPMGADKGSPPWSRRQQHATGLLHWIIRVTFRQQKSRYPNGYLL